MSNPDSTALQFWNGVSELHRKILIQYAQDGKLMDTANEMGGWHNKKKNLF